MRSRHPVLGVQFHKQHQVRNEGLEGRLDGMVYLDTLSWFSTEERGVIMPDELRDARGHIERGIRENQRDIGVVAKYLWIAKRYNNFRQARGLFSEPEIDLAKLEMEVS